MQGFTRNIPITSSIIASYFTDVTSSITTETNLFATTIIAGKMKANGNYIEGVYFLYTRPGAAAPKPIRAYFGGQVILSTDNLNRGIYLDNSTDGQFCLKIEIIRSSSSVAKSSCFLTSKNSTRYIAVSTISGLDFTGPVNLLVTGQGDGSVSRVTGVMGRVLFYD